METDFGGGQDWGFFVVVVVFMFVCFKQIVSIQGRVLSALEQFWPIVAKSC